MCTFSLVLKLAGHITELTKFGLDIRRKESLIASNARVSINVGFKWALELFERFESESRKPLHVSGICVQMYDVNRFPQVFLDCQVD